MGNNKKTLQSKQICLSVQTEVAYGRSGLYQDSDPHTVWRRYESEVKGCVYTGSPIIGKRADLIGQKQLMKNITIGLPV